MTREQPPLFRCDNAPRLRRGAFVIPETNLHSELDTMCSRVYIGVMSTHTRIVPPTVKDAAATFEAKHYFGRYAVIMHEPHQDTVLGGHVSRFEASRIADTLSASATDPEAVRALLELAGRPVLSVRKGRHQR